MMQTRVYKRLAVAKTLSRILAEAGTNIFLAVILKIILRGKGKIFFFLFKFQI